MELPKGAIPITDPGLSLGCYTLNGMLFDPCIHDPDAKTIGHSKECPLCGSNKTHYSDKWGAWHCFVCDLVWNPFAKGIKEEVPELSDRAIEIAQDFLGKGGANG